MTQDHPDTEADARALVGLAVLVIEMGSFDMAVGWIRADGCGGERPSPADDDEIVGEHLELTDREEEVPLTVPCGRTNAEIADDLHISLSTVSTHVARLVTKLGVRNRVELAMWAYETGRLRVG